MSENILELNLRRLEQAGDATIGELRIGEAWFCWTLEDKVRSKKIKHQTAIPAGEYNIIVSLSARFRVQMPLLLSVPEFDGIRIHPGNSAADTSGCILLGQNRDGSRILSSRVAYQAFMKRLAVDGNRARITITQPDAWPKWGVPNES